LVGSRKNRLRGKGQVDATGTASLLPPTAATGFKVSSAGTDNVKMFNNCYKIMEMSEIYNI
jgi:hypothetical protein